MDNRFNKPEPGEGIFFCECGSQDNVHALLGSWRTGDYVMWCECGKVTVRAEGEKKVVFSFQDYYLAKEKS